MGMIKDPTSWRTGFELGLAGFSFPYSKPRKPVAYLYNGARLPALPEWDKETYPFACLTKSMSGDATPRLFYTVHCFSVPFYVDVEEYAPNVAPGLRYCSVRENGYEIQNSFYADTEKEWNDTMTKPYECKVGSTVYLDASQIFWSNWDILHDNDTLFHGGSNPVPVYE